MKRRVVAATIAGGLGGISGVLLGLMLVERLPATPVWLLPVVAVGTLALAVLLVLLIGACRRSAS